MSERSWHYGVDGVPRDPVSEEDLKDLILDGELDPRRDRVWRAGMAEWLPVEDVEVFRAAVEERRTEPASAAAAPPPLPSAPRPQAPQPVDEQLWMLSTATYLVCSLVGTALVLHSVSRGRDPTLVAAVLNLVGLMAMVLSVTLWCKALYRIWFVLEQHRAAGGTSPVMAVGFLFIPVFQVWWHFVAVAGLPGRYNAWADGAAADAPRLAPKVFLGLSAAFALWCLAMVVMMGMLLPEVFALEEARRSGTIDGETALLRRMQLQAGVAPIQIVVNVVLTLASFLPMSQMAAVVNHFARNTRDALR